jgi:hypothetical protein
LSARIRGSPSRYSSRDERSVDWIILLFRCHLDHGHTVDVQPAFGEGMSIL